MDETPAFFIPDVPPEEQEARYAEMAAFAGLGPPPMAERVYSMRFRHDGIDWTATVGRPMRGVRGEMKRIRGQRVWKETPVFDATVIAAIFPGHPYYVFHTGGRSPWQNPFMCGDVGGIVRFSDGD